MPSKASKAQSRAGALGRIHREAVAWDPLRFISTRITAFKSESRTLKRATASTRAAARDGLQQAPPYR